MKLLRTGSGIYQCYELPGVLWASGETRTVDAGVGARILRDHPGAFQRVDDDGSEGAAPHPAGVVDPLESLPARLVARIERAGLDADDLRAMSDDELLGVRGIGRSSVALIREVL